MSQRKYELLQLFLIIFIGILFLLCISVTLEVGIKKDSNSKAIAELNKPIPKYTIGNAENSRNEINKYLNNYYEKDD